GHAMVTPPCRLGDDCIVPTDYYLVESLEVALWGESPTWLQVMECAVGEEQSELGVGPAILKEDSGVVFALNVERVVVQLQHHEFGVPDGEYELGTGFAASGAVPVVAVVA